jgi:hypothetical protein
MRGRLLLVVVLLATGVTGCGAPPPPAATATPDLPSLPLPESVSATPPPDGIRIEALTPPISVQVGVEHTYTLDHCGLFSPIDVDGSLWDPIYGDDGAGGPLTSDQIGDLINETSVALVLVDHETMLMVTRHGGRVLLTRHDGPRNYFGCM